MMNFLKNKRKVIIMLTLTFCFGWVFLSLAAEPGSEGDPLISLSYFENKIIELKESLLTYKMKSLVIFQHIKLYHMTFMGQWKL